MSFKALHSQWSRPDNAHLTAKQFSFRLPVHIAAKLAALCELYPTRNRTQIVADLLEQAIDQVEESLPMELGPQEPLGLKDKKTGQTFHECEGVRGKFRERANQIYEIYEMEQGVDQPGTLYSRIFITEQMVKEQQEK